MAARPRWFEVDHPETLEDKQRRLTSLGADQRLVSYVGADLMTDDVGASLGVAGHDAQRPTLFVGEGLFEHLTLGAAANLCTSLRTRAPEGSVLAVTFLVVPEGGSGAAAMRDALDRVRQAVGAPRPSEYREGDAQKLMVVTGWRVVRSSSTSQSRSGWVSHLLALAGEPSPAVTTSDR